MKGSVFMKKFAAISLASLLVFGSAQTALAKVIPYDLSKKSLELDDPQADNEYLVYLGSGTTTENVIIVNDGIQAYIILQDVNIETTDVNGISIGKNADVVLKLDGDNNITVNSSVHSDYEDTAKAGINVAEGTLTIKGEDDDSLTVKTVNDYYGFGDGAAIGSDESQDFSGKIVIEGGNITAKSFEDGAGIGSGDKGDMTGSITISGGTIKAVSKDDGAGIGSGNDGEFTGNIIITGGGIGSGDDIDMAGSIVISGGNINVKSNDGAGIGSSDDGDVTADGRIHIGGNADVNIITKDSIGVGSARWEQMNGSIVITDDASVDITLKNITVKSGIGASESDTDYSWEGAQFKGSISILEHATVNMKYDYPDTEEVPGIGIEGGSTTGTITLSTGSSINGVSGADIEKLKEMGILDEGTNTISVDPTPEPVEPEKPTGETYSLTPLNLKQRIDKAQPGETVSVSESQLNKEKLPSYILEALALKEDVTLAIFCEEFCILIPSDEAVADAGSKQFYTIDELVEMYE